MSLLKVMSWDGGASPFLGKCPGICSVHQEWISAMHSTIHLVQQLLTCKAWHKNVPAQNLSREESAEPCQNVAVGHT